MKKVEIEPRRGASLRLEVGQQLKVVDVAGGQVADLFAINQSDDSEYLSAQHTRATTSHLFPAVGDDFVTNRRRPILRLVADDSPGIHDMLIAACDPERYELLGVEGHHHSCQENYLDEVTRLGLRTACVPQSVNLFMHIPVADDGGLSWCAALTNAGDSVTVEAMMPCWIIVSACPQDIVAINNHEPTPIRLELEPRRS